MCRKWSKFTFSSITGFIKDSWIQYGLWFLNCIFDNQLDSVPHINFFWPGLYKKNSCYWLVWLQWIQHKRQWETNSDNIDQQSLLLLVTYQLHWWRKQMWLFLNLPENVAISQILMLFLMSFWSQSLVSSVSKCVNFANCGRMLKTDNH